MTDKPSRNDNDDDRTRIAPNASAPSPEFGFKNRLKIEGLIGEGGMGRVYLGYDETIGRRVAIKQLLDFEDSPDSGTISPREFKNTFLHEAKLTGKLEHPGIIPIYELGREDGNPYYVMRYVRGSTLESLLDNCKLHPAQLQLGERLKLLDVLIDVCETLAYAHSRGVIHRDLKPNNIIRGEFGETIVLDWGLAQVLDDSDNTYFFREAQSHQRDTLNDTHSTEALGTPSYMAPEQFQGAADKRSDVYSLGVILFRLLTGRTPYGGGFDNIQQQICSDKPPPDPAKIEKSAPPELIAICNKAMHKYSRLRFANAKEMAEQLKAFRDGRVVNIYAYSRKELLRRFLARNKTLVFMTLALLAAVLVGAGFSVHYAMQMEQAKIEAENSLVTVTSFSETAQKQAQIIASALQQGTTQLFTDLHDAADKLAQLDLSKAENSAEIVTGLKALYPKFEHFAIIPMSAISAVTATGWRSSAQEFSAPMAESQDQQLKLYFRTPITQGQRTDYVLEAEILPAQVLPDLFPMMPEIPGHPRDIWIMAEDGLIVYDKEKRYLGTNLFLDPEEARQSPSLIAFGRLTLTDDDGISYYSYVDNKQAVYKIAAWERVLFPPNRSWNVIVNYAYMSKPSP